MSWFRATIRNRKLSSVSALALSAALFAGIGSQPAHAIIVRDDVGLANSVDSSNQYPAVVQLFDWDVGNLYGGGSGAIYYNCTGTLINPRTILTAAHCVTNDGFTSSEDWGAPGVAPLTKIISFGVDSRTRLINFITAPGLLGYNQGGVAFSTDVIIHPSAEPTHGNQPFPWADTALIALDQPVADVNPMGMLLSPLTSLTHVVQIGYGTYGTGLTGQQGISTKRLMGENMLGLLGSDSDFIDGVFPGYAPSSVNLGFETQVEYYTDFDNPNRPSANAGCTFTGTDINCVDASSVLNIDFFPGNALPREVTTAPGDSGGPLIADQLGHGVPALVIGNLSGGWTFFGTPSDQYGGNGTSFYQPLFSVWQFIVQNDPYKYVGAKAGNGAWEDPNHWVQLLDPNMYIIDGNGHIVNGVPTGSECGVYQTGPKMGSVLGTNISGFSTASSPYYFPPEAGTCATASGSGGGTPANVSGTVPVAAASAPIANSDVSHAPVVNGSGQQVYATGKTIAASNAKWTYGGTISQLAAAVSYPSGATDPQDYGNNLPQSSPLLGPGSTGFVPDNTDGVVGTAYSSPAQYFDVTLRLDGTTTLSSYREIDRLTMEGNAGLNIMANGILLSNIDIEVYDNAHLNVDGIIGTSDIIADGGVISGNGIYVLGASIVPTSLSAIIIGNGAITAGGIGTVGTMTVLGNVGVSAGGMMLVDAGKTTTDLIDIYGGVLAMNGTVEFNSVAGVRPFWHQGGDFAYADSILTTGMSVPDDVHGVLYPVVALSHRIDSHGNPFDALSISLEAASYFTVFTPANPDQTLLARYFDGARGGSYSALQDLYGPLDVLEGTDLGSAFDQLVPNTQRTTEGAGTLVQNAFTATMGQRLSDLRFSERGDPSKTATGFSVDRPDDLSMSLNMNRQNAFDFINTPFMNLLGGGGPGAPSTAVPGAPASVSSAQGMGGPLAGWGGFFSASILNGHTDMAGGHDGVSGYMMTAGLDRMVGTRFALGGALSFSDTKAKAPIAGNHSEVQTYQVAVYGTWSDPDWNVFVDGFAAYGGSIIGTARTATLGGATFTATGKPSATTEQLNLNGGTVVNIDENIALYPSAGLEFDTFTVDAYDETGSVIAMHYDQDMSQAFLGHIALEAKGHFTVTGDTSIHPRVRLALVNDFDGHTGVFNAAFLAAPGASIPFAQVTHDRSWVEVGAGVDVDVSSSTTVRLGYDGTLGRSNATYDSFTAKINLTF